MESILKTDDLRFGTFGALCIPRLIVLERPTIFSDFAGNLECTLICFGTRIRKEDLEPAGRICRLMTRRKTKSTFTLRSRYKKRCELRRPLVVVHIARMDDFGSLFVYSLQALRHQLAPLDNIHTFNTP